MSAPLLALILASALDDSIGGLLKSYDGARSAIIVERCKMMPVDDFVRYLHGLGKAKDFAALDAIRRAPIPGNFLAAGPHARYMDHRRVLAFCRGFKVNSLCWREAFWGLSAHPKQYVIGYIRKVAESDDPDVRAISYYVCARAGWDDLRKNAIIDVNSREILLSPGTPLMGTLGRAARDYLDSLEPNRKP
jgi:hypothetical protein